MTDMFMALGTTLCMVSFWRAVNEAKTPWRWVFFIGLAVGLLAKGPVATVITGLALFIWVAWAGAWGVVWQRLPWWRGALLTALLSLPWYLLAEHRTPGFLQYFIVGEHFQRFLVSGWTGDLYGQGHPVARGLIWWFGFGGFLPWTLVALLALGVLWRKPSAVSLQGQGEPAVALGHSLGRHAKEWQYLVAWTVAPLLFFTSARNILEAYVLPGLPAFALLATLLVFAAADRAPRCRACGCWACFALSCGSGGWPPQPSPNCAHSGRCCDSGTRPHRWFTWGRARCRLTFIRMAKRSWPNRLRRCGAGLPHRRR